MQRGDNPLRDDSGVEGPRPAFDDSPVENQADLGRTAQVAVFADNLIERMAPGQGPVEDLGAGRDPLAGWRVGD